MLEKALLIVALKFNKALESLLKYLQLFSLIMELCYEIL